MKFPGGNPLLFCEQVGTVTSFFEQWNDCERTVVLYALLKRVPFANLKFLQLSIDYNLAQNYSSQSKLQLLESHANNANFLNKLVQRYQQTTTTTTVATTNSSKPTTTGSTPPKAHNNSSSCNISNNNNNLTISDAGYDSEKTKSSFDLSSTSSLSCSTTSGLGSSSSSSGSDKPAKPAPLSPASSTSEPTATGESKKDILNDMLTYLPLLKPGNDDVKSVYMSLIPAAVEDACQQHVPTELVQHILSYLLIHPAVNNDDRRSLSYWLRHLEEHIATSYIPTTLATQSLAAATTANNNNNNNNNTSNIAKHANSGGNYFAHNQQQHLAANSNTSKPGSQQSLQFLAIGPWQHHIQQQHQQHPQIHHPHQHSSSGGSQSGSCNQLTQLPPPAPPLAVGSSSSLISISNSSLLSRSQQSLNQTAGGGSSSSSSSSSCLDSTSSQLLKTSQNSSAMVMNLDWTTSTEIAGTEDGGGGGGGGGSLAAGIRGSMENLALKEFGSVSFNLPPPGTKPIGNGSSVSGGSKHHHHHHHQSGASGASNGSHHPMVLTADLDSSDDNHLSFSKNGTEIFDYDCDYDNEEEFNYLARAAAAVAAAGSGGNAPGGATAAGSAVTPGTTTTSTATAASTSKNRVSFDANINDYLRVPPIGTGDLGELDGASGLLKTRRSNSLTTTMGSSGSCGVERPVGEGGLLHQHQKQNNECLSAENLTNLQLLQNKPRSFSLTMESPRSSLTSSGSETRLDDFKQHHMMKMYGQQPNIGMASIAHWLKSLRLHKYVWLFSNLTYEQMMEMTEEYLASLGVTKGARHKLVLCIQKLRERHAVMLRLEKDLLTGGSKATLGPVFEELTNIVLTPMKPVDPDDKNDLGTQFLRLMDLIASLLFTRPTPQDEEYLNVYIWLLERALHNEAFCDNGLQLKELKYKASKLKMSLAPKSHYPKSAGGSMNGGINKPRWSVSNKHSKAEGGVPAKTPHRKSSLQYFSSPMQQSSASSGAAQPPPAGASSSSSSSSHTHLQAIPPHQYYGTGHNNNYNKSSSYPNFASNLSGSSSGSGAVKHQQAHLAQQPQQQPPHHPPGPSHVPHGGGGGATASGNFMYHRHSLNNISAHQHQQQFLQHLQQNQQQQQQQQQLLPSIYLSTSGGVKSSSKVVAAATASSGEGQKPAGKESSKQADLLASKAQNNSIGDINSRLEFLCLQMTEQAIN